MGYSPGFFVARSGTDSVVNDVIQYKRHVLPRCTTYHTVVLVLVSRLALGSEDHHSTHPPRLLGEDHYSRHPQHFVTSTGSNFGRIVSPRQQQLKLLERGSYSS
jgi:hypothetical protein